MSLPVLWTHFKVVEETWLEGAEVLPGLWLGQEEGKDRNFDQEYVPEVGRNLDVGHNLS